MAKVKVTSSKDVEMGRPAITTDNRESQLIALAYNLAEKQLRDGTASSQTIVHFLKQGTAKAELEKEKLRRENLVLEAKAKHMGDSEEIKILYENALKAMRNYAGYGDPDEY